MAVELSPTVASSHDEWSTDRRCWNKPAAVAAGGPGRPSALDLWYMEFVEVGAEFRPARGTGSEQVVSTDLRCNTRR